MQLDAIQWEFDLEAFEELHLGHSMGGGLLLLDPLGQAHHFGSALHS